MSEYFRRDGMNLEVMENNPNLDLFTACSDHIFHCFTIPQCYPISLLFLRTNFRIYLFCIKGYPQNGYFVKNYIVDRSFSLCGFLWLFVGI